MKNQNAFTLLRNVMIVVILGCINLLFLIDIALHGTTGTSKNVISSTPYVAPMDSDSVHCVAGYKMLSNGQQLKNAQGGGIPCP